MASTAAQLIFFKPYLCGMKMPISTSTFSICSLAFASLLFAVEMNAQEDSSNEQTSSVADTLSFERFLADSVQMDSAKQAQAERQATLRKELDSLSRSDLGTTNLEWNQSIDVEVERAGRSIVQRFWFDEKLAEGPYLWHGDTIRKEEWLWFDPVERRMATLFLNANQGNYISKRLAEMSGMMGNGTKTAKKKTSDWQSETDGDDVRYTRNAEDKNYSVVLGPKNPALATAVINWLRLQPIEGFVLPAAAKKMPFTSLLISDSEGRVTYAARLISVNEHNEPMSLNLADIKINDPERNLNVIAKEWAEKKKESQD
jgi:hypothetical protein